jgi:LytS/YehU family sensor histidine kinase
MPGIPDVAIEYVEKLADFYRSILQYREQESITLEEEFELVHNFTLPAWKKDMAIT